jgi:hypothetical protein
MHSTNSNTVVGLAYQYNKYVAPFSVASAAGIARFGPQNRENRPFPTGSASGSHFAQAAGKRPRLSDVRPDLHNEPAISSLR